MQKEYGYRNGQLLVVWDSTETGDKQLEWLVQDHLGSTRMVADRSGSLAGIRRHDFMPFGEESPAGVGYHTAAHGYASDQVRQRFTGYERDNETGLDFAQARYYANVQGRFTSADPIPMTSQQPSDPQRLNLYAYVRNNPLVHTDPNGLDLYATGDEAERYKKDLERATGLKLNRDKKTGKITIVKVPKSLSADAQKIADIINDSKNTVRITAINDKTGEKGILIAQYRGDGEQTLDYADINKFGKEGSTRESVAIHETVEGYESITNPLVLAQTDKEKKRQLSHSSAKFYENIYRARNGLGARVGDETFGGQNNKELVFIFDYTTHVEKITVDVNNPTVVKSVKVEKKP